MALLTIHSERKSLAPSVFNEPKRVPKLVCTSRRRVCNRARALGQLRTGPAQPSTATTASGAGGGPDERSVKQEMTSAPPKQGRRRVKRARNRPSSPLSAVSNPAIRDRSSPGPLGEARRAHRSAPPRELAALAIGPACSRVTDGCRTLSPRAAYYWKCIYFSDGWYPPAWAFLLFSVVHHRRGERAPQGRGFFSSG